MAAQPSLQVPRVLEISKTVSYSIPTHLLQIPSMSQIYMGSNRFLPKFKENKGEKACIRKTYKQFKICYLWLFSHSLVSDSLHPHGLQHIRLPCPSPSPRACSNSCPSSKWCHPTISSSVVPFSSCLQSFPASGSFLMSWFFASGGQSIAASACWRSVPPMSVQDWFPLGLTGLISLLSKRLPRIFSSTTIQKHRFFGAQPPLWPTLTSVFDTLEKS